MNSILKFQDCRTRRFYGSGISRDARRCRRQSRGLVLAVSEGYDTIRRASGGINGNRKTTVHKLVDYFGAITVPGCYDALSVKILQQAGHQAAYVSGSAVSATQLGEADLGLLTPPEMVRRTSQICNSVPDFPVIADIGNGGEGVLNVQRTVRSLIAAGAKGCIIEDKKQEMGQSRNAKAVVPVEQCLAKIQAAREVIGLKDFCLIARTDARSTSAKSGLDEAITRANLFTSAGADAHVVGGLRSVEELALVGENTRGLRVANMVEGGVTPIYSTPELKDMGYHVVNYPLSALYAATRTLVAVYGELAATGTSKGKYEDMVSWRAFQDILGLEDRFAAEDHFSSVQGPASYIGDKLPLKRVKGLVKPHVE